MAQAVLADGFVSLCISDSLNYLEGRCRVLIEGQKTAAGLAAPDTVVRVTSDRDINANFGEGSVLAESVRKAFCVCPTGVDLYVIPREDADDGVAAVYTMTIGGPATSDGRFTLYMGDGDYNIDFRVREGDTAAIIAGLLVAEIPSNFPFTAVAATTAGVTTVTFTAKNAGTVGNVLAPIYNWAGRANYAPSGVTVAFVQTTPGSIDPDVPTDYPDIIGECCYSCYILLSENLDWQDAFRDHIRDAWDCSKPQCFGHGYVYNLGTLGQVLATGDNSPELSRMALPRTSVAFPYFKVTNYGVLSCCLGCDSPEVSIQGQEFGLLACVTEPTTCQPDWSSDEVKLLKAQGFVVSGPANVGDGTLTNPYIYNDVTNGLYDSLGRVNVTFQSTNSRRLATATAIALATKIQEFNGISLFLRNTAIREGVQGTNRNLMLADIRAWARINEGVLFSEFSDINRQITLRTDAEVQRTPCTGRPGELYLDVNYQPPVRIDKVNTLLKPSLLENCNR